MIWLHNADAVAFTLPFGLSVRWYGLVYALGAFMVMNVAPKIYAWANPSSKITKKEVEDLVFWGFIGGVLGGRVFDFVFYDISVFWTNPGEILKIWNGGMSIHGGIIGALMVMWVWAKKKKASLIKIAEAVLLPFVLVLVFGRLANYANGELIGKATAGNWGVVYPWIDESPRHPSQFYHSAKNLIVFLVLGFGIFKKNWLATPGKSAGAFLLLYGVIRSFLHLFREDVALLAGLPVGVWLSGGMAVLGLIVLYKSGKEKKNLVDAEHKKS